MTNKVTELKKVIGAGARANKYRVYLTFPSPVAIDSTVTQSLPILCKATAFPSKTIGMIEVYNQGRKLVLPGDTQYQNSWNCTFYNTEEHNIRRAFFKWMKACDHFQANSHSGVPAELMITVKVAQLDSDANETAYYEFHNVFPSEISEIQMAADQNDQVEEYDVTFAFTDFIVGKENEDKDKPDDFRNSTLNVVASDSTGNR